MRGPSFIGEGKRPDLTPAHQVLLETGMIAGVGGLLSESPMILHIRTKPVAGKRVFAESSIEIFSIQFSDWPS